MARRSVAVATMVLGLMLLVSVARADTTDILERLHEPATARDGWQAGPCTGETPFKCAPDTPGQFFKTAGGHPPVGFVQFIVKHESIKDDDIEPLIEPIRGRIPKTVRVDLPPGLSINPEASPEKCTMAQFLNQERGGFFPTCQPGSKIGESIVTPVTAVPGFLGQLRGKLLLGSVVGFTRVDLFNIEPAFGEPALFGFVVANQVRAFLRPEISWEGDYHESFTIEGLPDFEALKVGGVVAPIAIHDARLVTTGNAGDGTFATNPTTCFDTEIPQLSHLYSSWIRMDSFEQPNPAFPSGSTPVEGALPPGEHPEGCENIPFDPLIEVDPGTDEVDSATSPTVTTRAKVEVPARGGSTIAESHLRAAEVTLPEGMGLNPAGSAGLVACSDADFHKGDRTPNNNCPADSVIGTAEIRTPVLSQVLKGNIYVGEQKSFDPTSGDEFRTFVEAKSDERGVVVRLIGNVEADPETGQLTAIFDEQEVSPLFGKLPPGLPQVPFESIALRFDGEDKIFTSPPTCSLSKTTSAMEPWARPGTFVTPTSEFTLSSVPGGGDCPQELDQRAFAPNYAAAPDNPQAGAFSPFRLHIDRPAGQQELKRINVTLPKGLIGRLAGIPYCSERAIAVAEIRSGATERKSPSCAAVSMVGTTSTESGTGTELLKLPGKVYLAGPDDGAPLSLVTITPAVSGPFDLGNVVIRVALHLDPATTQITAVSDVIPDVFEGVKLDLRAIDLNLDRGGFMVNPTNCDAQASSGAIAGGGSDPTDPAAFSPYPFNAPFPVIGCRLLGFGPKLITTLSGPTRRGTYPRLTTLLVAREGDANISSVALSLPHAFFVAQEHFGTVCTRPQLAAQICPPSSVYGEAEVVSPLLDDPLSGPVYLVPGEHPLPDLVVDLHGQVDIQLHGVVSTKRGGIEAVFDSTPDVPVKEFFLSMAGGKKSLIVNSTNICKGKRHARLNITAQNGSQLTNNNYKLNLVGCRKHPKHKKHKKHTKHGKHKTKKH